MATLNYLLQMKATADKKPSNSPNLTIFGVVRDIQGVVAGNPSSESITIPASGSITVFTSATKKMAYVEADKPATLLINGSATLTITPVVIGSSTQPGCMLINSALTSLTITNPSATDALNVFVASIE